MGSAANVTPAGGVKQNAHSWIDPLASSGDLVYASTGKTVVVYTYPGGKNVGTLTGFSYAANVCSDASGNVWIVTDEGSSSGLTTLIEYAHGGTKPIAELTDTNQTGDVCSVDPSTGNLAVGNLGYSVAVWAKAQGSPTFYSTVGFIYDVRTITYDGNGDLFFRGYNGIKSEAWLPKGGSTVMQFSIKKNGPYGWDGTYFAILGSIKHGMMGLIRYKMNGGTGTKVGHISLNSCSGLGRFSIEGSELAIPCYGSMDRIVYYGYPAGGNPITTISGVAATSVAISVGSSNRHRRTGGRYRFARQLR